VNADTLIAVEIVGLEPRRNDLARGIVIARSAKALDAAAQKSMWDELAAAGITERADDDAADEPARRWNAAPWLPPDESQLAAHRAVIEQAAARYELDAVWFVKVETGIDGVAWLELAAAEASELDPDDADEAADEPDDTVEEPAQEVLYAAPDAPGASSEPIPEATEDDSDEDLPEADIELAVESHWRTGTPPSEHTVSFPIEHYPEIIDDYDWESFGIAIKLAGTELTGEESVVNAFFALWLSVYQDERVDEFEPFQRADVVHDRKHRSALMWVERFQVPATAADQVHFLLWVIARLHEIVPLAWARFEPVDDAVRAHATEDEPPFVLAGNPFAERFKRGGEEAAFAWSVSQSTWSRRELAGMLVELALEHDPDEPTTAITAERLLRRAQSLEPKSDAAGYLAIVLVRQKRFAEAISLARLAPSRDVRLLVIGEIAEHSPTELPPALELLDPETARETGPEELADLAAAIARHAPAHLTAVLARLPDDVLVVPHLYNSSFAVDRPQALSILLRVLSLPEPARDSGEARTALVMAWNNACIHAHALGDYKLAVELADGGQRFGTENPYIYHSAACAYAAIGQIDRALDQVSRAIEHEYEHTEKMETDADLSPLHSDPRFPALFNEWRTRRADLN
jgi:tetratricopeptide (TPR) repeat protein